MSVKRARHGSAARRSWIKLRERLEYLSDPDEPSHRGKTLEAPRYHLCISSHCVGAYQSAVARYREDRQGQRGRSTPDVFVEYIYCSPPGVDLGEAQREAVARRLIERFCPYSPACYAWHFNPGFSAIRQPDGTLERSVEPDPRQRKWDLHVIACAVTLLHPQRATRWRIAGNGANHELAEFDDADREITAMINLWSRGRHLDARAVRKAAALKSNPSIALGLGREMAGYVAKHDPDCEQLSPESLAELIPKLGYRVTRTFKKVVEVVFSDNEKSFRFRIRRLLELANVELRRLRRLVKDKAKKRVNPKKDVPDHDIS